MPPPIGIGCEDDVPPPDPGAVIATDNCGSVSVVHVSDVTAGGVEEEVEPWLRERLAREKAQQKSRR